MPSAFITQILEVLFVLALSVPSSLRFESNAIFGTLAELTVSVAGLLVTLLTELVTTTRNAAPLSDVNVGGVVGAAVIYVELPKGGAINAKNMSDSIDLLEGKLAAENHAIVENDGTKIMRY